MKQQIMNKTQAEANATLYARAVETLAGRLNMGIRDFDAAYGGLNVVGESLIDDGVLNQALASNPPRGWVHSENPQDAINIWTTDGREAAKNEAVFWTLDNAADTGIADTQRYSHFISRFAAHHIYKEHGNAKTEEERGQIAVTAEDLTRIPDMVTSPDKIVTGFQSEQGAERVAYLKRFDDGLMVYIAEASRKKKDFRAISMRKYPPTAISENVIKNISSQSLNVRNGEGAYDNSTPNADTNQDILYQGGADRGMFSREHNLIALLKNADASTFVHELGHFFLETNTRIARDLTAKPAENLTGQERQFLSDVQTTLDWFGVKDLAAWDAMSLDEQRENHEKWERGFEAYLYEGKAPSEELRGVFRRFRSWLKQVYQSLKNLNVELTDEVRSVFDRMFAGDEQIQQTQYINGMAPMFDIVD